MWINFFGNLFTKCWIDEEGANCDHLRDLWTGKFETMAILCCLLLFLRILFVQPTGGSAIRTSQSDVFFFVLGDLICVRVSILFRFEWILRSI